MWIRYNETKNRYFWKRAKPILEYLFKRKKKTVGRIIYEFYWFIFSSNVNYVTINGGGLQWKRGKGKGREYGKENFVRTSCKAGRHCVCSCFELIVEAQCSFCWRYFLPITTNPRMRRTHKNQLNVQTNSTYSVPKALENENRKKRTTAIRQITHM